MNASQEVIKSIVIKAPSAVVWEILTDPKQIRKWLVENEMTITSEFTPGSPISFEGEWHGKKFKDKGVILEFEPNKVFSYSYWTKITRLPDLPENYSVIRFELSEEGNQTLLTLTHKLADAIAAYEHSNYHWSVTLDVIRKMAEGEVIGNK